MDDFFKKLEHDLRTPVPMPQQAGGMANSGGETPMPQVSEVYHPPYSSEEYYQEIKVFNPDLKKNRLYQKRVKRAQEFKRAQENGKK